MENAMKTMKRMVFVIAFVAMATMFRMDRQSSRAHEAPAVREVVEKSLGLLQSLGGPFYEHTGCVSCHNNSLPAMAVAVARTRGIPIQERFFAEENQRALAALETFREGVLQGDSVPGGPETISYVLLGLAAGRQPANAVTDVYVNDLLRMQDASGKWGVFIKSRPPQESSDFNTTALSVRTLQVYAPRGRQAEVNRRIAEARQWLLKNDARTNEDRVFQLLGLHWSGAQPAALRPLVERLRAEQHADGGWSQLPGMPSDAYATGQAMIALHRAGGVPVSDPAYQRGVAHLRNTWRPDGSWYVRSRSFPIQKQFASGFPHGRDQWISASATSWAVMALSLALDAPAPDVQAELSRPLF
jgi:Squalene-hopene cyclase C-terminal domain